MTVTTRNGKVQVLEQGLVLPAIPPVEDHAALCSWLTTVFNLNPLHPVNGAVIHGRRGPDGHVIILRAGAPDIAFEPASRVNQPSRLVETLTWQLLPTDGSVHAFKSEHCREVSWVIRILCGAAEGFTRAQEADAIVSTFTLGAESVEGFTTYGTTSQRYEAAAALRGDSELRTNPHTARRYLIDANTGELVIAVSDLQDAARRYEGSSLPHGWLDARIEALEWRRITLDGHSQSGRSGRSGPHARVVAYRGHHLGIDDPVTT
jgi:hypothetical protein